MTDDRSLAEEMGDPEIDPWTLSPEEELRLSQLLTRQAVANRRRRRSEEPTPQDATPAPMVAEGPSRWRLIPPGIDLYRWQREALTAWRGAGRRGTVKVATGAGKTLFALAAAEELQHEDPDLRVAIVVPTIPLLNQWLEELRASNLPVRWVGQLGGGVDPPDLTELRILVAVLNSARRHLPSAVRHADEPWQQHLLLVVDECHRALAPRSRRIFDVRPRYLLGLSATPEREEDLAGSEQLLAETTGPIIYELDIARSLEEGLLTPFEVWHIGLPLTATEAAAYQRLSRQIRDLRKELQAAYRRSRSKRGFLAWCRMQAARNGPLAEPAARFVSLTSERKRLLYRCEARAVAVRAILTDAASDPETRTILFHEVIEEVEDLYAQAEAARLPAVLEHSELPDAIRERNIELFRRGTARIVFSARSLIEGFNVPSADLGIIAASSSSVRQRIQSLGRMLRRKSGDRSARILVLYIRDTPDEDIYARADWDRLIGVDRNRYFRWDPPTGGGSWADGLVETGRPPRQYRPPSHELGAEDLIPGGLYPARADGADVFIDGAGNVRLVGDRTLVRTDAAAKQRLEEAGGRGHLTAAGHLIARRGSDTWIFLGTAEVDPRTETSHGQRLRVRQLRGRRVIAREIGRGAFVAAREGPTVNALLDWIADLEQRTGAHIHDLFWDGSTRYWVEVGGGRHEPPDPLGSLEF